MEYPTNTNMTADSIFIPTDYVPVTLSDTADIRMCRGLWVGVGGNVKVITSKGETRTISNVATGTILPGYFTRVFSTDTTATNVMAIY